MFNNNTADSRYELRDNDALLAFAEYKAAGNEITFTHTEVDSVNEGKGYGSELARLALDDAAARGMHVLPACGFIAAYIRKHPEYVDLVAPEKRHAYHLD